MKTREQHREIIKAQIKELRMVATTEIVIDYLIDELALERHFKERYEELTKR